MRVLLQPQTHTHTNAKMCLEKKLLNSLSSLLNDDGDDDDDDDDDEKK